MGASGAPVERATPTGDHQILLPPLSLEVPAWRACPIEDRETQTCRRGTARVLRIAESRRGVNDLSALAQLSSGTPTACATPIDRHLDRSIAASPRCAAERPPLCLSVLSVVARSLPSSSAFAARRRLSPSSTGYLDGPVLFAHVPPLRSKVMIAQARQFDEDFSSLRGAV